VRVNLPGAVVAPAPGALDDPFSNPFGEAPAN
jgi:hypothetical protein